MKPDVAGMLSYLRRQSGQNQREAAAGLGVSQALLSHYENGVREPRLEFIVKACDYYGVSADYLLGRSDAAVCTASGSAFSWVPVFDTTLDAEGSAAFRKYISLVLTSLLKTAAGEPTAAYDAAAQVTRLKIHPESDEKLRLECAEMLTTAQNALNEIITSIGGEKDK